MSVKRQTKRAFDEEFRQDAVKLATEQNLQLKGQRRQAEMEREI